MTEIKATRREVLGRGVKKLRKEGSVPGIVYGKDEKNIPVVFDAEKFDRAYKEAGETGVVDLQIEGEKEIIPVLIYEVSKDPLSNKPLHVDFYKVRMNEAISTEVPLEFIGESVAVKSEGGILVKSIHEIEIKALPREIPQKIMVDISVLKTFDDIIYVKDLPIPANVEVLSELDTAVAMVNPPRSEQELEDLKEEVGEGVSEEVAKEEEKKEGEAGSEAAEEAAKS